jgi:parvulin-like peptidyl-prolyl isomerase
MKRSLTMLAACAAALGLVAAGCGGGSGDVPTGAIAVVDGTEIARTELDDLMTQAKASYEAQKQDFPKVGTAEYQSIQQQYVAFLVQKAEFEQAAEDLDVQVTDADVKQARDRLRDERFEGDEKKLADALEEQGLSEEAFLETLRVSVLAEEIFKAVTKGVKVTDAEALTSYTQSSEQYKTPESREVRHILIAEKDSNGQVDYAKSKTEADRIYGLLQDGGDFAELAKENSDDQGSATSGGNYTANRGQSVPEFDKTAFALKTNEVSRPVKTQFGYHVIQALEDAKPAKVTPFDEVKASIKATLLQDKKSETMTDWVTELQKDYEGKVSYATGFAPPDLPEPTETETENQ